MTGALGPIIQEILPQESIKRTFSDSSPWDDGKFKKEDELKKEAHECVKHDHNLVIVKDCSTSWSSEDDDDQSTTKFT